MADNYAIEIRLTFGYRIFLVNLYIYNFSGTYLSAFHGYPIEFLGLHSVKIETLAHKLPLHGAPTLPHAYL